MRGPGVDADFGGSLLHFLAMFIETGKKKTSRPRSRQ